MIDSASPGVAFNITFSTDLIVAILMLFFLLIVALFDLLVGFIIAVITAAYLLDFITRAHGSFEALDLRLHLTVWETGVTYLLSFLLGISSLSTAYVAVIHLPTRGVRSKTLSYFWLLACGIMALLLVTHLACFVPRMWVDTGDILLMTAIALDAAFNLIYAVVVWKTTRRRLEDMME